MSTRRAQRLLERGAKMRLRFVLLGGLSLVLVASQVLAGPRRCGDDVKGKAVPCDCGDLLVSSRTIGPDDPITQHACDGTGLLVDVPPGRPAPTLGLGGQVLTGTGHGIGIQVLGGGDGGLTIVGPGAIARFTTGVLAPGGALARLSGVAAADNAGDGFSIVGNGYEVRDCEASRNRRDGFSLRGTGYHVEGNRAVENARHGFALAGREGAIGAELGNEASGNGRSGFSVRGRDHALTNPVAISNAGDGIRARVARGRIAGAYTPGNRRHGVKAAGPELQVEEQATASDDVLVRGTRSRRCRAGACR
jgi:Right handed beta helix region